MMIHEVDDEVVPTVEELLEECVPVQAVTTADGVEEASRGASAPAPASSKATTRKGRVSRTKKAIDRHVKVEGRGRSIRLPNECADELFELTRRLDYKWPGQTICWLLENADPAIIKPTPATEKNN